MNEHELREALNQAANECQLSDYQKRQIVARMKGEEPVKKKLSISIALVMLITLLTMSMAVALVHSTIVEQLFGSVENTPEEITERIQTPQSTFESALGNLSVDEWFYDGQALHTAFSVSNPTNESLFYTLDGITLNGQHVSYNRLRTEGAGDSGFLLGGTVDGMPMPTSVSLYNQGNELYAFDENGKYAGTLPIPEGTAMLKISFAVWKPLSDAEVISYEQYEGINNIETKNHLCVDNQGYGQLWLFRPEQYNLNYNASQSGAQVYKDVYEALGWMELLDVIEVETAVHLSRDQAVRVIPEGVEYDQGDYRLVLEQFDFSHAGGKLSARICGDNAIVSQLMKPHGFTLIDLKKQRILINGCYWDDQPSEENDLKMEMSLLPVTGDLPEEVYFAPILSYKESWDENAPHYDPDLEKPENVIDGWEIDLEHAIAIKLQTAR